MTSSPRHVLVVAATSAEIAPLVAALGDAAALGSRTCRYGFRGHCIDALTTGVGMVPTAAWTARALAEARYDLALDFGVCGSFDPSFAPGAVVHIVSDQLAEMGAEDGDAFLDLADLNLAGDDRIVNNNPPSNGALAALPRVNGITVNTVHGSERTIAAIVARCTPQVESMEGAAFMYACAVSAVPYAQVRAVSNVVERRNRAAWKLQDAIASLNAVALDILHSL